MNAHQPMMMRHLSVSAPMTGNSRVILSASIRNRPMDSSTKMITRAAISAVRKPPIIELPPTISDIGRAIRLKLMIAPPVAMAMTNSDTKNCTSDDDDSWRSARSVPRTIS